MYAVYATEEILSNTQVTYSLQRMILENKMTPTQLTGFLQGMISKKQMTPTQFTPLLHVMIANNHIESVSVICENCPQTVNHCVIQLSPEDCSPKMTSENVSALGIAFEHKNERMVKLLLDKGAKLQNSLLVQKAINTGNLNIVKCVFETYTKQIKTGDMNLENVENPEVLSYLKIKYANILEKCLCRAAFNGALDTIQKLVQKGAQINCSEKAMEIPARFYASPPSGEAPPPVWAYSVPLIHAIKTDRLDTATKLNTVKLLLALGADPEFEYDGENWRPSEKTKNAQKFAEEYFWHIKDCKLADCLQCKVEHSLLDLLTHFKERRKSFRRFALIRLRIMNHIPIHITEIVYNYLLF